jgi:hypothetical protein
VDSDVSEKLAASFFRAVLEDYLKKFYVLLTVHHVMILDK